MYKGQIPFYPDTDEPMYYPEDSYRWKSNGILYRISLGLNRPTRITVPPDWRPNKPFRAVMTIVNMSRGQSAANFIMKDEKGIPYTIFMTDLLDLIQRYSVKEGKTDRLEWCFCKRGQNYGIQLAR